MIFLDQKYCISLEFLTRFESLCGSRASVRRLREHPSYTAFMNKWSLPVYFQIRSACLLSSHLAVCFLSQDYFSSQPQTAYPIILEVPSPIWLSNIPGW